jgi:hypothetical protein
MVSVISLRLPEVNMVRVWRQQAGTLLIIYLVLVALTGVYGAANPASSDADQGILGVPAGLALYGFLVWRIWRHRSKGARDFLLVFSAIGGLVLIRAVVRWSPYLLGASALFTAQFVMLVSPAIRNHVLAKQSALRPSDDQLPSTRQTRRKQQRGTG